LMGVRCREAEQAGTSTRAGRRTGTARRAAGLEVSYIGGARGLERSLAPMAACPTTSWVVRSLRSSGDDLHLAPPAPPAASVPQAVVAAPEAAADVLFTTGATWPCR